MIGNANFRMRILFQRSMRSTQSVVSASLTAIASILCSAAFSSLSQKWRRGSGDNLVHPKARIFADQVVDPLHVLVPAFDGNLDVVSCYVVLDQHVYLARFSCSVFSKKCGLCETPARWNYLRIDVCDDLLELICALRHRSAPQHSDLHPKWTGTPTRPFVRRHER
jgi:hypothetical protein